MKKQGVDKLNVDQRLALMEEIWESIDADDPAVVPISDAKRAELLIRIADDEANPDDVVTWEEVQRMYPPTGGK